MLTNVEVENRLRLIRKKENKYSHFMPVFFLAGIVITFVAAMFLGAVANYFVKGDLGTWAVVMTMVLVTIAGIGISVVTIISIETAGRRHAQPHRDALINDLSIFAKNTYNVKIPEISRIELAQDITTPFLTRSTTGEVIKAEFALFEDNWVLLLNGKEAPRINSTVSQEV